MKKLLILSTIVASVALVGCWNKETPKAPAPAASAASVPASIPGVPTTNGTASPASAPASIPGVPTTAASAPAPVASAASAPAPAASAASAPKAKQKSSKKNDC